MTYAHRQRAIRRAKLARVLRFYADKARRHAGDDDDAGLSETTYDAIFLEIDRLIEKGANYSFASVEHADRGWMFCPEYAGGKPLDITPDGWETRSFLFGPDSNFRRDSGGPSTVEPNVPSVPTDPHSQDSFTTAAPETRGEKPADSTRNGATSKTGDATGSSDSVDITEQARVSTPSVCLGINLLSGAKVHWPLTVKGNPQLLVTGLPGIGKTTCLLNHCRQMLAADIRPIVFLYHQDIDEKLQQMVGSVRFIDFQRLGFNPLQVLDRTSRMAHLDVAGAVRDIFTAIFPELGDIQGERIRKAIKDSFVEHGWDDPAANRSELPEPPFSRFVEILHAESKPDRGLKTLLSRLDELDDYGFFQSADVQDRWRVVGDRRAQSERYLMHRVAWPRTHGSTVFAGRFRTVARGHSAPLTPPRLA